MSIEVTLKPSYEVQVAGLVGAAAQLGFVSPLIEVPFRINGIIITFGSDHIDNVLHYIKTSVNVAVSAIAISQGTNLITPFPPEQFFIGHNMLRHIRAIKEFPEGNKYLKTHIINNNAYAIQSNVCYVIEEL